MKDKETRDPGLIEGRNAVREALRAGAKALMGGN